ncbi:ROK family transcriptional regulator [Micrococcales bacterium 31B]|nr:ROK family transcriptional regulator [Micrococcales bacterium 31B]
MVQLPRLDSLAAATDRAFLACLTSHDSGLSRAQIAAQTGISKPAISDAAARLLSAGIIYEVGLDTGRRGRTATLLQVNPNRGHSLALALDSREIALRATDLAGTVIAEDRATLSGTETAATVISATRDLIYSATSGITSELLAATISMADPVERATHQVAKLPRTPFPAGHFDPTTELGLDPELLAVDNDVNWSTHAEAFSRPDQHDFVYIYVGSGIGGGLYLDGKVRRGARGLSGELGYLRVDHDNDLTQLLAAHGFGQEGTYRLDVDAGRALLESPELGEDARAALALFGRVVINTCIVLNPALVVMGGPLGCLPAFVEHVRDALHLHSIDVPEVSASVLGASGPLQGAALDAHQRARTKLGF